MRCADVRGAAAVKVKVKVKVKVWGERNATHRAAIPAYVELAKNVAEILKGRVPPPPPPPPYPPAAVGGRQGSKRSVCSCSSR